MSLAVRWFFRVTPISWRGRVPEPIKLAMENFAAFDTKMTAAGMGDAAIRAFRRNYEALARDESGLIPEETITSAERLPTLDLIGKDGAADPELLGQAVVIKLNGGLGTSMGLQGPKSLLAVRDGDTFLDLMVRQILDLRKTSGANVRLLLMNSFSTSADTLAHLERLPARAARLAVPQRPLPPNLAERLSELGHVGLWQHQADAIDPAILRYFADSGAPFLMEATRRTAVDRKGGHLAVRKTDGRLLLREVAQTPEVDLEHFQNIERHQYFNTNSLWLRLDLLKEQLAADGGVLPLPMIRNNKTIDPRDKQSLQVIQLESAMGAAIECFEGAVAIDVPRSRFAPVKTTGDLLALRSDAYEVLENGQVRLAASRDGIPPIITLSDEYKLVDSLDGLGVPSLIRCETLKISGPVRFEDGVIIEGDVEIQNTQPDPLVIAPGIYRNESIGR